MKFFKKKEAPKKAQLQTIKKPALKHVQGGNIIVEDCIDGF